MNDYVLVAVAGLIAGAMNALVGGGSFVTLPALIAAGVPSVQANTSSTLALYPAQLTTAWAYREGLGPIGDLSLRSLLLSSFIGGAIGAVLLLSTPSQTFDVILPWLLAVTTLTLAFGRRLGESLRRRWHINAPTVLLAQFGLGVYGGYFGGGVGIMMMAVWSLLSERTLKSFNAPRTLLVAAANTVAAVIFAAAGAIRWNFALTMLVTAAVGGYGGAIAGRRAPAHLVRGGTILFSLVITSIFFYRAYFK
jgi:uncharacterized membrane protein YfcA